VSNCEGLLLRTVISHQWKPIVTRPKHFKGHENEPSLL